MSATAYAAIEPHLVVSDGPAAIEFYRTAFGATELFRQAAEDGKRVMHATLAAFGGQFMLHDHFPEYGESSVRPPDLSGAASLAIHVNLRSPADVDAQFERATAAGATVVMGPQDTFWGMRYGRLRDPFGHVWAFGAPLPQKT